MISTKPQFAKGKSSRLGLTPQHLILVKDVCVYFHVCECFAYVHMCTTYVPGAQGPGKGISCPGTGVLDGCKLPCGC